MLLDGNSTALPFQAGIIDRITGSVEGISSKSFPVGQLPHLAFNSGTAFQSVDEKSHGRTRRHRAVDQPNLMRQAQVLR